MMNCTLSSFLYFSPGNLQKNIIQFIRKNRKNFVIFSEIMLDKWIKGCYYYLARVGGICGFHQKESIARTAMMQEIARKRGNFCGVCPVIGRLNCLSALAYIAAPG